jgi:hypothetical protein
MLLAEMLMAWLRDMPMVTCHVCHGEADEAIVTKCQTIKQEDPDAFCCVVSNDSDFMLDSDVPAVAFFSNLDVYEASTTTASSTNDATEGADEKPIAAATDAPDVLSGDTDVGNGDSTVSKAGDTMEVSEDQQGMHVVLYICLCIY